jgi:hypothetical protein
VRREGRRIGARAHGAWDRSASVSGKRSGGRYCRSSTRRVGIVVVMIHLSELHGAATHLAVVALPLFAILYFWIGIGLAVLVAAIDAWLRALRR